MQKAVQEFLVTVNERVQLMRECKHHMKVRGVNDLSPAFIHPDFLKDSLTVRTVVVTAGIIMDLHVSAIRTLTEINPEPAGFTVSDVTGSPEDRPIDTFFLSRHIHAHEDRLGWEHRLTCHSFRHAFGTHLYENGTDLLTIKALMGHKSLHSTTIYVHLSGCVIRRAVSPFDIMAGKCHG